MKVLVVGFCKTGTKSLDTALEKLGYRVSDYIRAANVLPNQWRKFFNGKGTLEDLREMYAGFDATSDMPAFNYWREFVKTFPAIKLIFMDRDEESWIKSWHNYQKVEEFYFRFPICLLSPTAKAYRDFYHDTMKDQIRGVEPDTTFRKLCPHYEDGDLIRCMRKHNQEIMEEAPKDKLLYFKLSEGWGPLCRFLGHDIPNIPFPHSNKGGAQYHVRFSQGPMKKIYPEMYLSITILAVIISVFIYLLM